MKTLTELLKEVEELPPFFANDFENDNVIAFQDVDDLLDELEIDYYSDRASEKDTRFHITELEDDWSVICTLPEYQKPNLDIDELAEMLAEKSQIHEDFLESFDKHVKALLKKHIDFQKLNAEMPEYYYEGKEKFIITKQDLLDYYEIKLDE